MIELDVSVFLVIVEALLVFAALFVFWLLKSRRLAQALAKAVARVRVLVQRPDARQYLLTESNLTTEHRHTLGDGASATGELLELRADYLRMEYEVAENEARDGAFWESLTRHMGEWHERHLGASAAPRHSRPGAPKDEELTQEKVQELFSEQNTTINLLKRQIADALGDSQKAGSLTEQVEKLSRANRELSFCVSTLESEIDYLRGQLAAAQGKPEGGGQTSLQDGKA
jgi:hypothetical protein